MFQSSYRRLLNCEYWQKGEAISRCALKYFISAVNQKHVKKGMSMKHSFKFYKSDGDFEIGTFVQHLATRMKNKSSKDRFLITLETYYR